MADTNRKSSLRMKELPSVVDLCRDPFERDFFQTLRRLQAVCREMPDFGTASRPKDESVRFSQEPSLAFAPSTIAGAKWNDSQTRLDIVLRFSGLLGPHGPMPAHLTEYVMDRTRHSGDRTLE